MTTFQMIKKYNPLIFYGQAQEPMIHIDSETFFYMPYNSAMCENNFASILGTHHSAYSSKFTHSTNLIYKVHKLDRKNYVFVN